MVNPVHGPGVGSRVGPKGMAVLLIFVAIGFLPSLSGVFFGPGQWYESLLKPSWTPPGWLFGPVWTFLYLTIGVSGALAWISSRPGQRVRAFSLYAAQLILNGMWSWLFFGLQSVGMALACLLLLWFAILGTTVAFYRIRKSAGILLVPYLLWTGFAGFLNTAIFAMNIS